jgi:hypothetical protein
MRLKPRRTSALLAVLAIPLAVVVLVLALQPTAWAVDADGDGRAQELSTAVDPVSGLEAVVHAWTTVSTDAVMEVVVNVKKPGSAPFWREYFYNRGTFTNFSSAGIPVTWMTTGDKIQLVVRYRSDSGALLDTETLEVTVP